MKVKRYRESWTVTVEMLTLMKRLMCTVAPKPMCMLLEAICVLPSIGCTDLMFSS